MPHLNAQLQTYNKRFVPFCQTQLSAAAEYLVATAKSPPFYKPNSEEQTVTNNEGMKANRSNVAVPD